jgi:predicted dehydrogenase
MGCGNWGRNFVRVLSDLEGVTLTWIVDPNPDALLAASRIAPYAMRASDIKDTGFLFDWAVIATPAALHVEHATMLLRNGKHVLVEKPSAMSETDAALLCETAKNAGKMVMVGHQLLFHPVFCRLLECREQGMIGRLSHIFSERTGPVDFAKEPGVIWSYGPHDVSMVTALVKGAPLKISASSSKDAKGIVQASDIRIAFADDVIARIQLAHSHAARTRRLTVTGDKGALIFDDSKNSAELTFRDNFGLIQSISPTCSEEPLKRECRHAARYINTGDAPLTGPLHIQIVTRILAHCAADTVPEGKEGL